MKYCVLIMDGAAGWPLPERGGRTSLELARTPNLDAMASAGVVGKVRTVPQGMEPSSACACMAILGYDPGVYYQGRSGIEARSMGVALEDGEVAFRCNLVAIDGGKMWSYSAGHISSGEGHQLIQALQEGLGDDQVRFYSGVGYRNLCALKGQEDTLQAVCTPPHDISEKPIAGFLPRGPGSDFLRHLMFRSEEVLREHPVNVERRARGDIPATMLWLFWGSRQAPELPAFRRLYGLQAALTSGVDLLRGLAGMAGIETLDIQGVTDGTDNDYAAQASGALAAFKEQDLVVIHIETPDEASHIGSVEEKIGAVEQIDREVVGRLREWQGGALRVLVLPDHATPIALRTHAPDPVPFVLWGSGVSKNGAGRFTEAQAEATGLFVAEGHTLLGQLLLGVENGRGR
ncbi:cofactor-independent phosphoglycerate mutase [Chloroflexota bacterium]